MDMTKQSYAVETLMKLCLCGWLEYRINDASLNASLLGSDWFIISRCLDHIGCAVLFCFGLLLGILHISIVCHCVYVIDLG